MKTRLTAMLALAAGLAAAGLALATAPAASATEGNPLTYEKCKNLHGWYVNPDEQAYLPEPMFAGLKFEGKDLIHHVAPSGGIDFADMDKVTHSFVSTNPGKVVFKVETSAPYSTIVTNADGKIWSTAMSYEQIGGQGNPVAEYTDLIGKPVKPGKVPFSGVSEVETFGVGYWVEEGVTTVNSITFHGTRYPLSCLPVRPTATPATTRPVTTAPTTRPATATPTSARATTSAPAVIPAGNSTDLPVTGPSGNKLALPLIVGMAVIGTGALLVLATRRRKVNFKG